MAQTPSRMVPLGFNAPDFELPDTDGQIISYSNSKATAKLVMFISNHCPFVKHLKSALAELGRDYVGKGLDIFAISSNDVDNYPDDSPDKMAEDKRLFGYSFPYLFDECQSVAKAYQAECTPDFFLFDGEDKLVYRGQFDDSRPGKGDAVTGGDLRGAVDAVLAGESVSQQQKPSIGCNIKWRS